MSITGTPSVAGLRPGRLTFGAADPWYAQTVALLCPLPLPLLFSLAFGSRNWVVCQLAPSPLLCERSSRLQLNPLKPVARSEAGTCPCKAVSGWSPGPQVALGTVSGIESSPCPLPSPLPLARSEEHTSELQSLRHLVCR